MASPRSLLAVLITLTVAAFSHAGPVGPLPNVTSADMGIKEGTCAVGDVVYLAGDEFPGATACERCACAADGVSCTRTECEPRPGCKALHRPDQCCPIYQCECEQAGRVYGNGEKLVDPLDPCRVCYCQGGEVVCRRIACFVRDDCTPRLVPGRCCPEYDNCPLRGVTSLPGMAPASSAAPIKLAEPAPPNDDAPKITIKEITPVSEIPVITDVKIKEILPSPSIEVAEYSSSKSPPITREATSEKDENAGQSKPELETPSVIEVHSTEMTSDSKTTDVSKGVDDAPPSKISLSTQDSINSDIYPSKVPIVVSMGVPTIIENPPAPVATSTKSPVIEEEDSSLFVDHNPFPPLPDDLSVLSNHGDEIVPEPSADTEQIPMEHALTPEVIVASVTPLTAVESKELPTTTHKYLPDTSVTTTEKAAEITTETATVQPQVTSTTETSKARENPTVKLRSAIPTESVTASSEEARNGQEVTSSTTESVETSTATSTTTPAGTMPPSTPAGTAETSPGPAASTVSATTPPATTVTAPSSASVLTSTTTEATEPAPTVAPFTTTVAPEPTSTPAANTDGSKSIEDMSIEYPIKPKKVEESYTEEVKASKKLETLTEDLSVPRESDELSTDEPEIAPERVSFFATNASPVPDTTVRSGEFSTTPQILTTPQEQTTSSIAKSNAATEVTSQTELSSLPIETSDQNPHDASENVSKETPDESSGDTLTTSDRFSSAGGEVITVSKPSEHGAIDSVETTEFVLTSLGSSESATDAVELIKISGAADHAAIIEHPDSNKNALTDLIKLVSDVASIGEHGEPGVTRDPFPATAGDSDELIPVNAGYKSKNSNANQNSITEVPSFKSKPAAPAGPAKQRVVEIEDSEEGALTDAPAPLDRAEPTTRRPTIDSVRDQQGERRADPADIEIIAQQYVPTLSKRPTKVVLEEPPAAPQ